MVGCGETVTTLPPMLISNEDELVVEPKELLDTCYSGEGHLEVLVQWNNLHAHETEGIQITVSILGA